jgi:hypothetical protein
VTTKQERQLEKFNKFTAWMCKDISRTMFCAKANFLVAQALVKGTREICLSNMRQLILLFCSIRFRSRSPVATVVGMVADGMTDDEIFKAYPDLEPEDIREALRFAADAVRERELPLVNGR